MLLSPTDTHYEPLMQETKTTGTYTHDSDSKGENKSKRLMNKEREQDKRGERGEERAVEPGK